MSNPPVVSVITVVRNDRAGLERTVKSVCEQTWPHIEHLVVDGASTDDTREWLAANEERVRGPIVSEPDRGIYDAMNKGIVRASGDIVVFMNAADEFAGPDTVSHVAKDWSTRQWEWAYGGVQWMRRGIPVRIVWQSPFSLRAFARGRMWVPHQSTYVLRTTIKQVGGFREEFGVGADQELLMRVARRSDPHVFSEVLSNFELGGAHASLSIWQREIAWRRMRRANFGSNWLDLPWTVGLASYLTLRHSVGRVLRSALASARAGRGSRRRSYSAAGPEER